MSINNIFDFEISERETLQVSNIEGEKETFQSRTGETATLQVSIIEGEKETLQLSIIEGEKETFQPSEQELGEKSEKGK